MPSEAVSIAFQNANRSRADVEEGNQRQAQIYNQVLQGAQVMSSMADRAKQREMAKEQFGIVQDLRERQLAFNQQQSMAQLAMAKEQLASKSQSMSVAEMEAIQLIKDKPVLQDIQNDLANAVSDPRNKDKFIMNAQKKAAGLSPKAFGQWQSMFEQAQQAESVKSLKMAQDNFAKGQTALQTRLWDSGINPQRAVQQDGTIDPQFAEELINAKEREKEANKVAQSRDQATFESDLRKKEPFVDVSTTVIDEDTGARTTTRKKVSPGEATTPTPETQAKPFQRFKVENGKLVPVK